MCAHFTDLCQICYIFFFKKKKTNKQKKSILNKFFQSIKKFIFDFRRFTKFTSLFTAKMSDKKKYKMQRVDQKQNHHNLKTKYWNCVGVILSLFQNDFTYTAHQLCMCVMSSKYFFLFVVNLRLFTIIYRYLFVVNFICSILLFKTKSCCNNK